MVPEAPDAAETVRFLRRFADLMSNGNNAEYLRRAAELTRNPDRSRDRNLRMRRISGDTSMKP